LNDINNFIIITNCRNPSQNQRNNHNKHLQKHSLHQTNLPFPIFHKIPNKQRQTRNQSQTRCNKSPYNNFNNPILNIPWFQLFLILEIHNQSPQKHISICQPYINSKPHRAITRCKIASKMEAKINILKIATLFLHIRFPIIEAIFHNEICM
jgi:hypothetical protein